MSGTMRLTDDTIRAALTPAPMMGAPAGLADAIRASVDVTPQRRAGILGWAPSPRTRLALQLVAVGLLLLALLVGALVVGSRLASPPSMTTYHGGPEHTGVMPGPGPRDEPSTTWSQQANGPFGAWSPVVVDGAVYVADQSGGVTAFDEATGSRRWQHDVGASINSGITYAGALLLVGDDDGVLHALDAASGAQTWSFAAEGPIHGPPAVVDGVGYFGTTEGYLYAVDLVTQQLRWPVVQTPGPISRAVAVAGGIVYAGSGRASPGEKGSLGAYDAATGHLLWSKDLDPGNTSTPTVADGLVFVASGLDPSSGGRRVYAFDARTGASAWPAAFTTADDNILLLGAVANGRVYATGTDGLLYVLDASHGTLLGEARIQSRLSPNAGIVGHTLYVTSDDRQVHAFDVSADTPAALWSLPVTGTPGAPAVIDGSVFVGTSLGVVVRLGDSTAPSPFASP